MTWFYFLSNSSVAPVSVVAGVNDFAILVNRIITQAQHKSGLWGRVEFLNSQASKTIRASMCGVHVPSVGEMLPGSVLFPVQVSFGKSTLSVGQNSIAVLPHRSQKRFVILPIPLRYRR